MYYLKREVYTNFIFFRQVRICLLYERSSLSLSVYCFIFIHPFCIYCFPSIFSSFLICTETFFSICFSSASSFSASS